MKSLRTKLPPEIAAQMKKRSKYRAVRTQYNGVWYDSKAEAKRADELYWCMHFKKVAWWLRQVPIQIGDPAADKPYRVDFLVAEYVAFGMIAVHAEDVKGVDTPSFRRHVKQWRLKGPFPLHVIYSDRTDVIQGASTPGG